jgi:hypothetical protein
MTDIESRLKEALKVSVADAAPGFDVMAAVRRRHRRQLIRAAIAGAVGIAALATATAFLGLPGRSAPGVHPNGALVARAVARVSCAATKAKPAGPLPAAFRPVAAVRCYPQARGIPGHGLWRFEVRQQADHHLAALISALRRPSDPTPPQVVCPQIGYLDPPFVLVDRHGRIDRPALPVKECGQPFPAAIADLQRLGWVTVWVRRTAQLSTRAELRAGCDPQWKDVLQIESGSRLELPSAGGPAFSRRPPQLRVCIYRDSTRTFIRGGILSQATESELLGQIQGGSTSARCSRPSAEYAVLLAVSPAHRGGQVAEVELGGCDQILRPDNRVGTVSPAGLRIIRGAGRQAA